MALRSFKTCILYNQRDATCTMVLIIISAVHISGCFSAHHQELKKLYVQPWVLSCFHAVYRWCGWDKRYSFQVYVDVLWLVKEIWKLRDMELDKYMLKRLAMCLCMLHNK